MARATNGDLPRLDKKPAASAVRAQLSRVLQSPAFKASARKSKFLSYVVEQTLAGRGDRLTAYDVAIGVFNRDEQFDPRYDPLVRITARRVRAALDQYYLTGGRDDALKIVIPKGQYRPVFESADATDTTSRSRPAAGEGQVVAVRSGRGRLPRLSLVAAVAVLLAGIGAALYVTPFTPWRPAKVEPAAAGARPDKPRIVVTSIRNISANPGLEKAAETMTQEVKLSFCCAARFEVVPPSSSADFELEGSIQEEASGVRAQFLIATGAGKVMWMHTYTLPRVTGSELDDAGVTHDIAEELTLLQASHR
jgi:TolB-like protein